MIKEKEAELKELKPDRETPAKAISKTIGEKAFLMEKKREKEAELKELKPDTQKSVEAISKAINEKLFLMEKI